VRRKKNRGMYRVLVGIPEGKRPLGRPRNRWKYNIKMDLQERLPEDRIPRFFIDWIPRERRKRGRTRKTWMEGEQVAMTTRKLEPDQWRNREEWRLVSGRRR